MATGGRREGDVGKTFELRNVSLNDSPGKRCVTTFII